MTNGIAMALDGNEPAGDAGRAGRPAGHRLTERDDVLVRLNTALAARDAAARSREPRHRRTVIHIDRRTEGQPGHLSDSVHLFLADGGKATVIETFSGSDETHVSNHASDIAIGNGR